MKQIKKILNEKNKKKKIFKINRVIRDYILVCVKFNHLNLKLNSC